LYHAVASTRGRPDTAGGLTPAAWCCVAKRRVMDARELAMAAVWGRWPGNVPGVVLNSEARSGSTPSRRPEEDDKRARFLAADPGAHSVSSRSPHRVCPCRVRTVPGISVIPCLVPDDGCRFG